MPTTINYPSRTSRSLVDAFERALEECARAVQVAGAAPSLQNCDAVTEARRNLLEHLADLEDSADLANVRGAVSTEGCTG